MVCLEPLIIVRLDWMAVAGRTPALRLHRERGACQSCKGSGRSRSSSFFAASIEVSKTGTDRYCAAILFRDVESIEKSVVR
jgi:hypothetical protein